MSEGSGRRVKTGSLALATAIVGVVIGASSILEPDPVSAGMITGAAAAVEAPSGDVTMPISWWQFDRNRFTDDETGRDDLEGLPLPAVPGLFDTELVFRVVAQPALAQSLSVTNSFVPFHWSTAWTGMTFGSLMQVVSPLSPGAEQTIAARWPDDETGTWRLTADPVAAGEATLRARIGTSAGEVELTLPAETGQWVWLYFAIDSAGLTASLELRDLSGEVISANTIALPGDPRVAIAPMTIGRDPDGVTGDLEVLLDIVAGWDRVIDEVTRRAVVDEDGPRRYVEFAGWPGFSEPGRGMERIAGILAGDRRHVVMGDSFAFAAGWNRVFPSILKVRDFEPFVGVAAGVRTPHTMVPATTLFEDAGPPNPRAIGQQTQYQAEWIGGTSPVDVFGLPTNRVMELRATPSAVVPADGGLLRLAVSNGGLGNGVSGPLSEPGDRVAFRLIHRRSSDAVSPLASVRLTDAADEQSVDVDLTAGEPRQVATTPHALVVETTEAGTVEAFVRESTPGDFAAGPERFAHLGSVMAWRVDESGTRVPGQYYTSLHDSSWSWQDFGRDTESQIPSPLKSISQDQLVAWLTATTLDPDQPMAFWWYVDTEDRLESSLTAMMRAAIDMADAACAEAGLPRPVHLAVVPHLHQTSGRTRDQLWTIFERYRRAIDAVVDDPAYDHVARYSIFDATDGMQFDFRPESVAWLAERGYDAFTYGSNAVDLTTYGSLLDQFDAHPLDPNSAAFFASFLGAAIPDAPVPVECLGDVTGDDLVDFADLLAIIEAWGPCPAKGACDADLDADGLVGILDLLEVLGYWGTCIAPE